MARRKKDSLPQAIYEFLLVVPWWGGPIVAVIAYLFLRLLMPLLLGYQAGTQMNPMVQLLGSVCVGAAPLGAMGVLVIWVGAELTKLLDRKRLDRQDGVASIRRLPWQAFERLLYEAFRRQGYSVEHAGQAGPDGGIDLVLRRDGTKTLVQCKQWRWESVNVKLVRELMGVVAAEGADHGIFVTSGSYTPDAIAFAEKSGLTLIDGDRLAAMIKALKAKPESASGVGLAPPARADIEPEASPVRTASPGLKCPKCGAPMKRRIAKRGANAGSEFWGCAKYPACRGIRACIEQTQSLKGGDSK